MIKLNFDFSTSFSLVEMGDIKDMMPKLEMAHKSLVEKSGKGNEFLGWLDSPIKVSKGLILDLQAEAEKIRKKAEVYVVVGIGGSYLGSRAIIEALKHSFDALYGDRNFPQIIYAGQTLSEDYMADLLELLDKKDYCLTVISKSGTTLEPAIAFRILKSHLEKKYGKQEARERIIAITDKEKGALKNLAIEEGYKTYIVPNDVGGRYSLLTPVGLLPIAVAGFDIDALVEGARLIRHQLITNTIFEDNPAWQYATYRNLLYSKGKSIEMLVNYLPTLQYFSEWWKQLFGESEGKDGKGLFPASVSNTTDLHSMGQYIQDGERLMFETIIHVENSNKKVKIPYDGTNNDGLNYLSNISLTEINHKAEVGTSMAHIEGKVPQIIISLDKLDEEHLGKLVFFFEFSCGLSGYLLGVNPFDQPGVEAYKNKMFTLLGK